MKVSRRVTIIAVREAKRLIDVAAASAEKRAAVPRASVPTFRPPTEAETASILGGELLARVTAESRI